MACRRLLHNQSPDTDVFVRGGEPAVEISTETHLDRDFDAETRSAALALIGQYGIDAEVIAVMRAAELAAAGDIEGLAAWDDILACLEAIEAGHAGARPIQ